MKWTTPNGFQITQHYRDLSTRQVKVRARHGLSFQKITKLTLQNDERPTDPMNRNKQATALAPNFVHSLDASHLAETVRLAKSQGITSFAMVHDSYATTAAHTDLLAAALRTSLVSLYTQHAPLTELRDRAVAMLVTEAKIEAMPATGSLDLRTLLDARYLFS